MFYEKLSMLCASKGMMPIELLKLSVSNVNLDEQTITGVGAKTQKRRTSPIIVPDIVMPVLKWLVEHADNGRFYTRSDKRYREDFKRCLARLGISTEHTPYDCRHTTATMYSTLLDPHTLTEVMRHTNLEMTQHYKHTKAADILHEVNLGIKKEQGIYPCSHSALLFISALLPLQYLPLSNGGYTVVCSLQFQVLR